MNKTSTRFVGVTLIAIYNILSGLLLFLPAILVPVFVLSEYEIGEVWLFVVFMLSALFILFSLLLFFAAYGLWRLRPWGWHLNFWMYLGSIFISIPIVFGSLFSDGKVLIQTESFISGVVAVMTATVIVIYLRRETVKKLFFNQ